MSTSLAVQLQARQTLDASRLQSAKALKHPPTFIFTPRHAASVSNADLHSLASNAWEQLAALDPFFNAHFKEVLGEQSKTLDRTGLTKEENEKVGKTVDKVLRALGKHMLLKPAGVVLEWLVRRFRVQDFNVPGLIALFLPYHNTAHFPSALNLLNEQSLATTPFAALIPAKKTLAPIDLTAIVDLLPPFSRSTTARPMLDFILHLPLDYLKNQEAPYRALTAFWLQAVAAYLDRAGTRLPDGERAAVLSTVLEVLRSARSYPDTLIASYILVSRFALHNPFDAETLRVVLKGVVTNRARSHIADEETDAALVTTLVVISQLGEEDLTVGEGKKFLGNSGWKSLLKTDRLDQLVVQLSNQYDAQRFLRPFLHTLAEDALTSEESLALFSSLLIPRPSPDSDVPLTLPATIIPNLLASCFSAILSNPSSPPTALLKPLSQVYQRYPIIWTAQSRIFTTRAQSSSDSTALPRLLHAMNAVLGGTTLTDDSTALVLSASAPDVAVRVAALKNVLTHAQEIREQGNEQFVKDTLMARLAEPEVDVAKVLFADEALKVLEGTLEAEEVVEVLKTSIASAKKEEYLAVVLPYIAGRLIQRHPALGDKLVKEVFWPRLLATKADVRLRLAFYASIKGSQLEKAHHWFKGIGAVLPTTADAVTVETNDKLVEVIAKNMAAGTAGQVEAAIDFLVEQVESGNGPAALLAYLVALRFAGKVEKSRRVGLVKSLFSALKVSQTGLDALVAAQPNKTDALLQPDNSGVVASGVQQALFVHPGTEKTAQQVKAALLVGSIKAIHPLADASWSWLSASPAPDSPEAVYRALCHSVYRLAHAHTGLPASTALSTALLEALFTSLVIDDALAFLASVFTSISHDVTLDLRLAALRDATIFIEVLAAATASPKGKVVDWQVIVPSLVAALADDDKRVRTAALRALDKVRETLAPAVVGKKEAKVGTVYGRDKMYGSKATASALKYLDLGDLLGYLNKLLASRTELTLSPTHLAVFHSSLLDVPGPNDSPAKATKRKSSLSFRIAIYLVSHAQAWKASLVARVRLLAALEGVKDKDKSAALLALVREAVADKVELKGEPDLVQEYARLVLQPFDGAQRKWLESEESAAVQTLVQAIETQEVAGLRAALRKEALRLTAKSVFSTIRGETRVDLFNRLVKLAVTTEARVNTDILACIRKSKVDGETITAFLDEVRAAVSPPPAKGAKRGRTSLAGAASTVSRTERIPELVVVLESVEFGWVSASHGLVLGLFDLLASLVDLPTATGQTDISYPGQLILGVLARIVENVEPSSGITSDSIRMAPVIDFMRSSINPQTYHQSLLLLAQLGPLVPDQLVHNVMPIFTFMGANVLQRDDAYSLRVVDQTLDNIVPALVKATQKTARGRERLLAELKELLRAFTDAANHVPRHRRINLFVRLVETLGPKEFLSAISMLLVDKAGKATAEAASLPLTLIEHFSVDVQLAACKQVVEEMARLVNLEESFLQAAPIEGRVSTGKTKDTTVNLLNFLGFALEAKQLLSKVDSARTAGSETVDTSLTDLLRGLLDIGSATSSAFSDAERSEIAEAAEYDVHAAVALLSTKSFAEALLWLLELADPAIQPRAFALLRTRLPHVKPTRRGELSPAITTVIEQIQDVLASGPDVVSDALDTLDVIANSTFADEDAALAKIVLPLVEVAKDASKGERTRAKALEVLRKLTNRLGPRLIPLVAKLVPFALDLLQTQAKAGASAVISLVTGAYDTLEGLFSSVPSFVGGQLDKVFSAALSTDIMALSTLKGSAAAKSRAALLSTAAKKLPAKTLYPAIIRLHASLSPSERDPMLGLLDLLNRGLRYGKTTDIADNYRSVYKLLLTVFDSRRTHAAELDHDDMVAIEDHALGAFVQFILKLNEQTFRPLFLRTYDWAVIDLAEDSPEGLVARRTVLYKIVDRLLGQLRSIFVPYFSFMLDQTVELLDQAAKGELQDEELWAAVASALTKAFEFDEGGFWSPARLGKLATPVAHQLEAPAGLFSPEAYNSLVTSYSALLADHEPQLKAFNSRLLHLTRSDDLRVKRGAIDTLDVVWQEVGDGMLGLVPESTPFLAEAREETEGGVEAATRKLIKRIEEHLGESLDEYLEQ
ncbi:U3 small nucleolar RNA-associated protein 10 [Rhodotorula toruloides]|uniref:U3 small nucleolar RNA-associated protein 10 n=1 Tax=Rhodotorula toruloides TaxID=5286 RepID=A0A511KQ95_RHOTO|nr:U3 small nucleolar RNA-associated protein 10 [Rhodotorula toruloides]